jgi:hypothetical protein
MTNISASEVIVFDEYGTMSIDKDQKKLLDARMAEYAKKRQERLRDQAARKKKLFGELSQQTAKLEKLQVKWEQEELNKAKTLAKKQLMEIQDIENRKKKNQAFSENIRERAAKARETVKVFETKEAAKLAEWEKEKAKRKEKKAEEERKWQAYQKRIQQKKLSPTSQR